MSIETGTRLGQYEVQDLIGQGAMGVVYRAYHVQLERTGAVKVLQGISPDADSTARFRHEAQAIAQMRHSNIVNVFDFGEYQGTPYMIIEYVPGGSLASRIKEGPMTAAVAVKYLRGIAAGLDYAHSLGIVHRDVKPANVLLEKDETPVIADFGLVKLMQSTSLRSMTGVTTGTPAYMAPEQVTGSHAGPAADRYSLATIAYEMLTGVIPFDGEGLMEVLYAHVHREPPKPSERNPSLGPEVDAVIMRGLAKDPAARWETCIAFVDALEAALAAKNGKAVARTMGMAPGLATTRPLAAPFAAAAFAAAAAPTIRVAAGSPSATIAVPYPAPAQPVAQVRSRKRKTAVLAAGLIALFIVLLIGFVATHQTPLLALSAYTVTAGETLVVTASRVPANQNGEIQLHSTVHTFSFHADGSGNVSIPMLVPRNIGAGDHSVQICWSGQCRASTTLHVVEPGTLGTPSPATTATPASTPGATPSHSPTPSPTGSPTPRPSSSPTPAISVSNYYIKVNTGTETVSGAHFAPGSSVTITFFQTSTTSKDVGSQVVSSGGYFSLGFTVPSTAKPGPASIKVCGKTGCLYTTVEVTS
ncbi:MAG TPA: serine/threonine-protein kinase [Candidatus Dormibacteraeota bacterium]|nr:serine/threonine-protein kinase [Candidatus Dormibacteraeota bacterium]